MDVDTGANTCQRVYGSHIRTKFHTMDSVNVARNCLHLTQQSDVKNSNCMHSGNTWLHKWINFNYYICNLDHLRRQTCHNWRFPRCMMMFWQSPTRRYLRNWISHFIKSNVNSSTLNYTFSSKVCIFHIRSTSSEIHSVNMQFGCEKPKFNTSELHSCGPNNQMKLCLLLNSFDFSMLMTI